MVVVYFCACFKDTFPYIDIKSLCGGYQQLIKMVNEFMANESEDKIKNMVNKVQQIKIEELKKDALPTINTSTRHEKVKNKYQSDMGHYEESETGSSKTPFTKNRLNLRVSEMTSQNLNKSI